MAIYNPPSPPIFSSKCEGTGYTCLVKVIWEMEETVSRVGSEIRQLHEESGNEIGGSRKLEPAVIGHHGDIGVTGAAAL